MKLRQKFQNKTSNKNMREWGMTQTRIKFIDQDLTL